MVIGRPRKYREGAKYSTIVFYYPSDNENQIVLKEFIDICDKNKSEEFYCREGVSKKGLYMRRFIYIKVLGECKNRESRYRALHLLLEDTNECIKKYNKNNKTQKEFITEEILLERYNLEKPDIPGGSMKKEVTEENEGELGDGTIEEVDEIEG